MTDTTGETPPIALSLRELTLANEELSIRNKKLSYWRDYAEAILSTIREPLVVLDSSLRVKTANDSFYKTFRTTKEQTEAVLFYELQDGQWNIADLRDLLERNIHEKTFYDNYKLHQKFKFIGERIMLLNVRRILSEGDNEQLILLAFEDITEKETIDISLKKTADILKSVLESSPQIASMASIDGAEIYFNQFFLDYSGLSFADAVRRGWEAVVHPDMVSSRRIAWKHSIETGSDFSSELLFRRHDGIFRWHSSRALAIRDDVGNIISWVGSASDIHDQKMFSDELENKVEERTESLKKSNIQMENSNRNLEQFAFVASHDLQEPLRKIKIFSSMLIDQSKDQLSEKGKHLVELIHKSSDRMSLQIHDILEFSRVGNSKDLFSNVDLNDTVNNVISDFEVALEELGVKLVKTELNQIEAIPFQMTQLFQNLFSNSLKFVFASGRCDITIKSRIISASELVDHATLNPDVLYCEILFEDNGIGIEQEYQEKIFEIFQRLHSKDEFPGTGIGLALCRRITDNHHGEIMLQKKETPGTLFRIVLPVKQPME